MSSSTPISRDETQAKLNLRGAAGMKVRASQTYTIAERVEESAQAFGSNFCLAFQEQRYSYAQLNEEVNRVAHILRNDLGVRCGVPIVPIHLDGTGRILPKGSSRPRPGTVRVNFGAPLLATEDEDARQFAHRVEAAVAELADETTSDWWSARRRAASGATPSLRGDDLDGWRRDWVSPDRRPRQRLRRRWPD